MGMIKLDIVQQRLHHQQISQHTFTTPSDVVAWMGAMQAQDYTGAKHAIGLRLLNATDADIEQALVSKTIIRTWPLRGTLHFVAAADLRWMLALMGSRLIAGNARRYKELELDEATLLRSNDVLLNALMDGKQLTRKALLAILEQNGISTKGQRAPYLLQRASLDALICQSIMQRNDPTYIAIDDSLPGTKSLTRDEALAELAKRYFTSHGPATLQDFVWWTGLPTGDARAGLESVKDELVQESIDGQIYWLNPSTPTLHKESASLYLLPGFDEYMLGYRDRSAILDAEDATKVVPGGNGVFKPTIVSNGRIVGTWKRTIKKDVVTVTPEPFTSLTDDETQAFAAAAYRYGEYMEMPVILA